MTNRAPTDEQATILAAARDTSANMIINALAGCIAAGTLISIRRGNDLTVRKRPIEALLHLRKPEVPTKVLCNVDGYAAYQEMIKCVYSGVKRTLRLETTFGEVIATPDHKIQTDKGWISMEDMLVGNWVFTRERIQHGRAGGRVTIYSVQHHPDAHQHTIGEYGNYGRISRARLVLEAEMNNISLEEMILIVRHDPHKAATLKYLPPGVEIHHIDGDPSNDEPNNLAALTKECHQQLHKTHLQHTKLGLSKVISITEAGLRHTYDIMMPGPHHNFLANGHVVHNCGKTSTLEMVERATKIKPVLYLVFNTKNAKEAERRMASTTTVRTCNSMGHRVWARTTGRNLTVSPRKTADIFRSIVSEMPKGGARDDCWAVYSEVAAGVAMAKALGYIPDGKFEQTQRLCTREELYAALDETPDDLTADLIDGVLTASIKSAYDGLIDYNDQLYMPAMFGGTFPQFPLILVDEAQDLSPVNHALIRRLCPPKSNRRVIAVGDRYQSIYGFRGAAQNGMAKLAETYSMTPFDLSVSFRCPRRIVEAARWRVPHFKWIKDGGFIGVANRMGLGDFPETTTIVCRNNAPLLRLAMRFLCAGRPVSVAGSDVGPKLVGILRKLGSDSLSQAETLSAIDDWEETRLGKGSKTAADIAESLRVFAGHGSTLSAAIAYAEHLFKQEGTIRLITGHKAKGLEFPEVYHLDGFLIKESSQEKNLRYVILTRSMDRFISVESEAIEG